MTILDQKPSPQKVHLRLPRRKTLLGREQHTLCDPRVNGGTIAPDLMEPTGKGQGVSHASWVRQLACQGQCMLAFLGGLVWIAKEPQHLCGVATTTNSRVMAAVEESMVLVLLSIVQRKSLL
jgi:hypothetical protein